MRKRKRWLVATVCLLLASFTAVAADPFVLEELHLIHWEQVPDGRPSFTGPVSAAVLMAWTAQHGYPALLPDLNGDGRTDDEDTVLLARDFAEEMGGDVVFDRLADPFIVYPLARYVAERYPDTFRLLIYDASFPEEVERDLGQSFDPDEVPGIVLDVLEDPYYELYVAHLEAGRPGIVGIGFDVPEWNDFAVSRSYVPGEHPAGMPVDLVSTGFEQFVPEPVWEAVMRWEPDRWGFELHGWIPFETLIVLIPEADATGRDKLSGDEPGDEPGDGPGDDPGDGPGDPDGGDQPRYPGIPGGDGDDPGGLDEGVCCLPDGSCQQASATLCTRLGGTYTPNASCAEVDCLPGGGSSCAAAYGEITDICYTYDGEELSVYASYAIHNSGVEDAVNITAYALIGLNDGAHGFGGLADSQDWRYGLTIPSGGTYTYDVVYTTRAPNLDPGNLTYLYGSLWLQTPVPWDCWPIAQQAFVQTWDPAPRCDGIDGGTPGGEDGQAVCCLPDGTCMILNATDCDAVGGAYIRGETDCASVDCGKILVGDCPVLSARILDICRTVDESDGSVTVHVTAEMENSGVGDAQNAELIAYAGWGFTGPNQTLYAGPKESWTGALPAGQKVTHSFALDIGTAPDWATFHPYATVAAWIDDLPCDWQGEHRVVSIDPDGSIPLCPPEDGEPGDRTTDPEDGTGTEPELEPEPEPEPVGQPNLWVTDMTGCWTWSGDGREHVMATVTGIVHNGGQADATSARARVTANGVSDTVYVGTIPAGGQRSVSATIDAGAYDGVGWPLPTSITADPLNQVDEADESNNTTNSSFSQSSDCN